MKIIKNIIIILIFPIIIGIILFGGFFYIITGSYKSKPKKQIEYSQYHHISNISPCEDCIEEDSILSIY